eukprot:TRINITY_DN7137_c0_g1_i2.p1 TRINITY_DN7137_c0_g1~~TRINITY_DN7137_c0_g1_i2.p1  ORF type:complete len:222 (-),score=50.22 TRINITY_DN7137_c0_g1_i2:113-778(-)
MAPVEVSVVLDFMCPWSYIGMKSLHLAKERFAGKLDFAVTEFIPFEFGGDYPPEGTDYTEYLKSCGARAQYLLNEKVPRCFAIGKEVGIDFSWKRRVYHTVNVNTALDLAQKFSVGEEFALKILSLHNEHVQDPNDPALLQDALTALGVPADEVTAALEDEGKAVRNAKRTQEAQQMLTRGGVPEFFVRVKGGPNLCASRHGSPTSPEYFIEIFEDISQRM